jgi:hypothetical protein
LARGTLASQGTANYRGETDPRKLSLVIAGDRTPVRIDHASFVKIEDVVSRGSAIRTLEIRDSSNIDLDRVFVYGGSPAIYLHGVDHLRMTGSSVHGLAAPWSSRASMKYRGNSPYLLVVHNKGARSHDLEIAYSDFFDSHDGIVIDSVKALRFHHNRLDNFNDDGIYLTMPRDWPPEDVQIYENVFSHMYTVFSFAEEKVHTPIGPGVYIFRNVFDLREGTYGWIPKDAATDAGPLALLVGRLCADHGSPTWEPMFFYFNTVLTSSPAFRGEYGAMIVHATHGTKRRVFDNLFVQTDGPLGVGAPPPDDDVQIDGNLMWNPAAGPSDALDRFRGSPAFAASKRSYPPGWMAHDVYADPRLVDLKAGDVRLRTGSPAVDAGVAVPADWPDTLRKADRGAPDIGALPLGAPMLRAGSAAAPR